MTSLEHFVLRIKPALDAFLRHPNKDTISNLDHELSRYNWSHLQIFHKQILAPLILKLDSLNGFNQELQTGTMNCIRFVVSQLYLNDAKALKTMLVIVIKQIRESNSVSTKPNLSEEIKLAVVDCITELFQRSTSDVLEEYYTQESGVFLGQILLSLVEFLEHERYKKLLIASLQCLMTIFYVYDGADVCDVVLRCQVANALFMYLPKIVTVLFKISLGDVKLGETLISTAVQALSRILCLVFEETNAILKTAISIDDFRVLVREAGDHHGSTSTEQEIFPKKVPQKQIEENLKALQAGGRSNEWFHVTSSKLRSYFYQMSTLRSHESKEIRREYAHMWCALMRKCSTNLQENLVFMLDNVVAMTEDEDDSIRTMCQGTLTMLQSGVEDKNLFDESAELLFEEHMAKLPRIISRWDDAEQYAELVFLNAFFRNLSSERLQVLLSLPQNVEILCDSLLVAAKLKNPANILVEMHALRDVAVDDYYECSKLRWRSFYNLCSNRSVKALGHICSTLGKISHVNRVMFDYFMEILVQRGEDMNEAIMILIWLAAADHPSTENVRKHLVELLLNEILDDVHWHLSLQPDRKKSLANGKHREWFMDCTPGLYESATEIQISDCDYDDDSHADKEGDFVTADDARFNIMHTCLVLDAVAHCATTLGEKFDSYLFKCLHNVLSKLGSSNCLVYESAKFALFSIQKALRFTQINHCIESSLDYLIYHVNKLLKRQPVSGTAVDILTITLQLVSSHSLHHLDSVFDTIRGECTKRHQFENTASYLKVFLAFLTNTSRWQNTICEIRADAMAVDTNDDDLCAAWLSILERPTGLSTSESTCIANVKTDDCTANSDGPEESEKKEPLPHHIQMIKDILEQVTNFLSTSEQSHQVLSLDCLTCGFPLLRDYENELLPLVHRSWQPLVDCFRQKDPIILNRCFTLLAILGQLAKDFITRRSLDDVTPFLKEFLKHASVQSQKDAAAIHTQDYKLQKKLLVEFPKFIQNLQIDGKHLYDISDVVSIYLSRQQPMELQQLAEHYFKCLHPYNGPMVYSIVMRKSHLDDYSPRIDAVLKDYGLKRQHSLV